MSVLQKTCRLTVFLLVLIACRNPQEPAGKTPFIRNAVSDSGAVLAAACGRQHGLTIQRSYDSLELWQLPGAWVHVNGQWTAAYGISSRVYVTDRWINNPNVWAHEFLHRFYALPGDVSHPHPQIFTDCNLLYPTR